MANVKFNREEFEKQIKLTEEIIEKIALFGVSVEKTNDKEIELEILPNRPDLLSIQGFIRSFKAFLGKEKGIRTYKINKPEKNYKVEIDSSVKAIRAFAACAIVKNISFDDEKIKKIIELQEKLHSTIGRNRKKVAIGIYPLEKIKLPIKYIALHPEEIRFIPLGNDREMNGSQILNKHPVGKEYAHLLARFEKYPVFIDSANKILSMPPIINSDETGKITSGTKEVFIECSGIDFNILKKTLNIIVTSLIDMGGRVYSMELSYDEFNETTPNLKPEKMRVSLDNVNRLLGLNIKESELSKLVGKMGYNYKNGRIEIPAWRLDILHEVDVIEDIAIAYGYDRFIPEVPNTFTIGEEEKENKIKSRIAEVLVGLGLLEVSSYHLIKKGEIERTKLENLVELEDSKTDYKFLRSDLLTPILRIMSENKDADYPQKIFELGRVFIRNKNSETGIMEEEALIIASSPSNFTEMKQIFNYLMKMLGLEYKLEEIAHEYLIDGRTASIILNSKAVGYMGDLHPKTLRDWNIKMPVSVIEISLEEIFKKLSGD